MKCCGFKKIVVEIKKKKKKKKPVLLKRQEAHGITTEALKNINLTENTNKMSDFYCCKFLAEGNYKNLHRGKI